LLNLYDPYAASFVGRAGEEVREADCAGASVIDLVDDAGRDVRTRVVEGGEDSAEVGWLKRCARLFTVGLLTGSCAARVAAIDAMDEDAGPDTERTEGFAGFGGLWWVDVISFEGVSSSEGREW
jgi:hypothetical protein